MFEIRKYSPQDKPLWDSYVAKARNATFLFRRDYMDYHSDRFSDHSLLFFVGRKLHSLMPAHADGTSFCTHLGLTYGGLVVDEAVSTADVVRLFAEFNDYLRQAGFTKVVYRPVPWVYHTLPAEEDLYAMFWQCRPTMTRRLSGTVIFMERHLPWRKDHRRRLRLAHESGVKVVRDASLAEFWPLLEENLRCRFGSRPVHTLQEIALLKSRFPDEIIQYNAYVGGQLVGGITFYVMGHVLHGQYSSTNDLGKQTGAMEAIYEQVMYHDYRHCKYLDFGTSNEADGSILNEGLIAHKEGYGGRTVCYDTYEWVL